LRLACLGAAVSLAEAALPEQQPYPRLHDSLAALTVALGRDDAWAPAHLAWERDLLADLGYGLDVSTCAVTGAADGLAFVSPRTGRAVSASAAGIHRDRLLVLPRLLGGSGRPGTDDRTDLLDGLALTGHFLDRCLFQPHDKSLPAARGRYVDRLTRLVATGGGPPEA
jgi:DNA repair protein RecO (recombination protein O)